MWKQVIILREFFLFWMYDILLSQMILILQDRELIYPYRLRIL